jgi:TRAP-type mannitol/chloroaromatic compound transport system substrate-binding protein
MLAWATPVSAQTVWNVSLWGQPRAFTEHVERLAILVDQKTNSQFRLNLAYGGLSPSRKNLDGISEGKFEMAQFCAGYHPEKNASITVLELPFLGISSLEQERRISQELYRHPAVIKDLAKWNATLLMPSPLPQYNLVGTGDAPRAFTDFVAMPIRATGGIAEALGKLRAVPTSMSATEVQPALASGLLDAVAFAPHAHLSFGTVNNAKWWTTNFNPGTLNCPVVVNTNALNALTPEHRAVLLGSVDAALDHYVQNYNDKTMIKWEQTLSDKGIKKVTFRRGELSGFKSIAGDPIALKWISNVRTKDIPTQELYDMVIRMARQP